MKEVDSHEKAYVYGCMLSSYSTSDIDDLGFIKILNPMRLDKMVDLVRSILPVFYIYDYLGDLFTKDLRTKYSDDLILDHSKIFPTIDKKYHTSILAGIHDCCADSKGLLTFTTDWCSNIANFIIDTIDVPIKEKGDTWVKYDYVNYIDFRYVIYTYIDTRDPLVSKVYLDDSAIFPTKAHGSDVGYDLTIIKKVKDLTGNTGLFDTGIKVTPPNGFYTEIVPRSSLSKSGYILANSVGIIDPGYNGNLLIALTKIDQSCEDLVLPFKCCQLIFKFQYHNIKLEKCIELSDTTRNDGGFGSSDLV